VKHYELLRDEFDDVPGAPVPSGAAEAAALDGNGDASMFEGVPEMGETIPIGTYHFRLDKWQTYFNESGKDDPKTFADGTAIPKQPAVQIFWNCQQEPHTGRTFTDFTPWVSPEVRAKAKTGDAIALAILKDRLWKFKSVMKAAGFTPGPTFDLVKDFLAQHPEVKIQVGLKAGKTKNAAGQYVEDGSQQNKVVKFLPLARPA
jgi:hypothetical protein